MRTTRIILALSPLLLLLPNLVGVLMPSSPGGLGTAHLLGVLPWRFLLGGGVGVLLPWALLLAFFPWNLMLAGVAYGYARHRGRGGAAWATGVLFLPFVAPLVLACMPATKDSASALLRESASPPATTASTAVPIEDRLPLLDRCLAVAPGETRVEQQRRFARAVANLEFSLWVDNSAADRIAGGATARDFTVWMEAGEAVTHLYGAGKVLPERRDAILGWLRGASASGRVLTVALRDPDGGVRISEFYKGAAAAAGA